MIGWIVMMGGIRSVLTSAKGAGKRMGKGMDG